MDGHNELISAIIGAAMEVHNYLGPGLIKSIHEKSLQHELSLRDVVVRRQVNSRIVARITKA
jgi:GxxExxY protein